MRKFWIGLATVVGLAVTSVAHAVPISSLPGLSSITVWERTGAGPTPHVFAPGAAALLQVRSNPLGAGNTDISGAEAYDLFYSNSDGVFNANGAFLTITSQYPVRAGGALNIAGVQLNFGGAISNVFNSAGSELANVVTHVVALGATANAASAANAVDGVSSTHSSIGDTYQLPTDQRLVLTVGFDSSAPVSAPASLALAAGGLLGVAWVRRRRG